MCQLQLRVVSFTAAQNQNAAKAVVSTASQSQNATILNLLNSAPAAMTHATSTAEATLDAHKLLGRTVSIAGARLITTTATHTIPTFTHQVIYSNNQCFAVFSCSLLEKLNADIDPIYLRIMKLKWKIELRLLPGFKLRLFFLFSVQLRPGH